MSLQMTVVAGYLRLARKWTLATPARAQRRLHARKGPGLAPARVRDRYRTTVRSVGGFDCWTLEPANPTGRAVIYLHGGYYVDEIAPQHWTLVSRMADAGVRVEVPLYGLAPRYTYREAYPFVTAVYRDLVSTVDPGAVTFAGDSAGGGLALGLAQHLLGGPLPLPGRLVLITPWVDATVSNPDIPRVERTDPWLTTHMGVLAGRSWAGGDDPAVAPVSPLNGPFAGLPPIDLHAATRDICYPDSLLLRERAEEAGVRVSFRESPGAVHVHPLTPTPEGRAAVRDIVRAVAGG